VSALLILCHASPGLKRKNREADKEGKRQNGRSKMMISIAGWKKGRHIGLPVQHQHARLGEYSYYRGIGQMKKSQC